MHNTVASTCYHSHAITPPQPPCDVIHGLYSASSDVGHVRTHIKPSQNMFWKLLGWLQRCFARPEGSRIWETVHSVFFKIGPV